MRRLSCPYSNGTKDERVMCCDGQICSSQTKDSQYENEPSSHNCEKFQRLRHSQSGNTGDFEYQKFPNPLDPNLSVLNQLKNRNRRI